jgi:hypothetical protein
MELAGVREIVGVEAKPDLPPPLMEETKAAAEAHETEV